MAIKADPGHSSALRWLAELQKAPTISFFPHRAVGHVWHGVVCLVVCVCVVTVVPPRFRSIWSKGSMLQQGHASSKGSMPQIPPESPASTSGIAAGQAVQ